MWYKRTTVFILGLLKNSQGALAMADERDMWIDSCSSMVDRDFDRGFVQMSCNKRENGCSYGLPHYHCQICGNQVNNDELRRDYHPCCSSKCIRIYNQQFN